MNLALPMNPLSAPPAPARPTGSPQPPAPAALDELVLAFADALGMLGDIGGEGSADASEAPPAGGEKAAADGKMETMPAALTAPPAAPGMVLAAMPQPALPDAAGKASSDADSATDRAAPLGGTASPGVGGGIAARLAALAAAGAPTLQRPPAGDAGAPLPSPTTAAANGNAAADGVAAAAPRIEASAAKAGIDTAAPIERGPAAKPDLAAPNTAAPAAAAAAPAAAAAEPAADPAADPAAAPAVKLPAGAPEQWRRPLLEALGDRIRVEVGKRSEHAVIRLDPPMMGSIEVVIRHQAGTLQVQLSASNGEVLRQLQSIGDNLRQDLAQRQYTDVSVQVFADSHGGHGRQRPAAQPEERQPGRALAEAEGGQAPSSFALMSDVD